MFFVTFTLGVGIYLAGFWMGLLQSADKIRSQQICYDGLYCAYTNLESHNAWIPGTYLKLDTNSFKISNGTVSNILIYVVP